MHEAGRSGQSSKVNPTGWYIYFKRVLRLLFPSHHLLYLWEVRAAAICAQAPPPPPSSLPPGKSGPFKFKPSLLAELSNFIMHIYFPPLFLPIEPCSPAPLFLNFCCPRRLKFTSHHLRLAHSYLRFMTQLKYLLSIPSFTDLVIPFFSCHSNLYCNKFKC